MNYAAGPKSRLRRRTHENTIALRGGKTLFKPLLLLTLSQCISDTNSFVSPIALPRINKNSYKRTTPLHFRNQEDIFFESLDQLLPPSQTLNNFLINVEEDSELKSVILRDLSHIILDFFIVFLDTETSILRFAEVIARILGMSSGYIEDQTPVPDELFFQIFTLAISLKYFLQSGVPIIKAHFVTTNDHDQLFFEQVFQKVDIRWIQFKSMIAENVIDWVEISPNTLLISEDCLETHGQSEDIMYWLLKGDIEVSYDNIKLQHMERTSGKYIDDSSAYGLVGDMRFLYHINEKERENDDSEIPRNYYPMATVRTGKKGATMIRIKGNLLCKLMENDVKLYKSIKLLLLTSLQRKVGALLLSKSNSDKVSID